jgi:hypothetical protein
MNHEGENYRAGICNIGEREVVIRRKFLLFSLFTTIVLTILVHFYKVSILYCGLYVSAFFTILILLEIRTRFCILFGMFSLYNFKEPGNLEDVTNPDCKKKDRKKAMLYVIGSALLALPYVVAIWFFTK